jgi:branched-subunit amino acid transport protein
VTAMQEIVAACRTFCAAPMWRWPWRARWIVVAMLVALAGPGLVVQALWPSWWLPCAVAQIAASAAMIRWREPLQRWMGGRIARAVWR